MKGEVFSTDTMSNEMMEITREMKKSDEASMILVEACIKAERIEKSRRRRNVWWVSRDVHMMEEHLI